MTVQETYLLYCDKVLHEAQFRHAVRNDRVASQYVSVNNSTADMINILKNRGVLSEPQQEEAVLFRKFNIKEWANPAHKLDSKVKDDDLKKYDNINLNQLRNGANYEFYASGQKDWDKSYKKAGDNLVKNPNYYINKLNGIKDVKKRTDLPIEVKKDNFVDKDNAMKPAKKGEKLPKSGLSTSKKKVKLKEDLSFTSLLESEDHDLGVIGLLKALASLPGNAIKHIKARKIVQKQLDSGEFKRAIEAGDITAEEVAKILDEFDIKQPLKEDDPSTYDPNTKAAIDHVKQKTHIDIGLLLQKLLDDFGLDSEEYKDVESIIVGIGDPDNKLQPAEAIRLIKNSLKSAEIYNRYSRFLDSSHSVNEYADGDEDQYEDIDDTYGTPDIRAILEKPEWDNLGFSLPGEAMNTILLYKTWKKDYDLSQADAADIQKVDAWRSAIISKIREGSIKEVSQDDIKSWTEFCISELMQKFGIDRSKAEKIYEEYKAYFTKAHDSELSSSTAVNNMKEDEDKKFNYNDPKNEYKYYVVQVLPDGKAYICEGFTYQQDAIDRGKEIADEQGKKKDTTLKVLTKQGCEKYNLNPDDDSHWKDPVWSENSDQLQELVKVIRKKIQSKLNEGDLYDRSFTHYALRGDKVIAGFQSKADSTDFLHDHPNKGFKIADAHSLDIDPQIDSNWKHIAGVNDFEFKGVSEEINNHIVDIEGMMKQDPEQLAKRVLTDTGLSKLKKQIAAKVLSHHIKKGNKDIEVNKAFQSLSDQNLK